MCNLKFTSSLVITTQYYIYTFIHWIASALVCYQLIYHNLSQEGYFFNFPNMTYGSTLFHCPTRAAKFLQFYKHMVSKWTFPGLPHVTSLHERLKHLDYEFFTNHFILNILFYNSPCDEKSAFLSCCNMFLMDGAFTLLTNVCAFHIEIHYHNHLTTDL